jgi:hypothetical protein
MLKITKIFARKYESGKLAGFADIQFALSEDGPGCLTIKGFKLFRNDDGEIWVALPSNKDEKDPTKYFPTVIVDKEKEDGKKFLAYLNTKAQEAYAQLGKKSAKADSKKDSSTIADADLMF